MKTQFSFMDPSAIMSVIVALIMLGVGAFAFFTVISQIPTSISGTFNSQFSLAKNNTSDTGTQVFNIIGIVLIIGAIMSIVGMIYAYIK